MERTIKLKIDGQEQLLVVKSSARTIGELKNEVTSVNWKNTAVIDRASKNMLAVDESLLPAEECLLFVMPQKSKSGAYVELSYKEAKARVKELKNNGVTVDFNYTQATTARLNEFLKAYDKKAIKPTIAEKAKKIVGNKTASTKNEPFELTLKPGVYMLTIEGCETVVEREIIVKEVPEGYVDMKILVDTTTIKDLNAELASLKSKI